MKKIIFVLLLLFVSMTGFSFGQIGGGGGSHGGGSASFPATPGVVCNANASSAHNCTSTEITNVIGTTPVTNSTIANAVGPVPFQGTVIPVFKTLNGFDNLGQTLGNAFALGSGGSGLVAAVQGTLSSGYQHLNTECDPSNVCRIDFLVNWDPTDTTGAIQVGVGPFNNTYQITLNNTASGTLNSTFFNVGGTTTAVADAVGASLIQLSVGMTFGNGGVTTYVCPTGVQHNFTPPNNWRTCQYFYQHVATTRLNNVYIGSTSTTSTVVGFMANTSSLDGDPNGRILTRAVAMNMGGSPNCFASCSTIVQMDHDNVIYLGERANSLVPMKTVFLFHGRTSNGGPDNCGGAGQSAPPDNIFATCYFALANGYNVISDQGGNGVTNQYSDYWGNPHGVEYAKQTYETYKRLMYNLGYTYAIGQSMGGAGSLNYMRTYPNDIRAAYEATPAIDLNETGCPRGIACPGTLKITMDLAYKGLYVSVTPTLALTLSAAATAVAGSTVYTGTITGGGSNAFAGITFVVAGFTTAANNGTFVATASTTTTLTLSNAAGVLEVHAGTATSSNIGNNPATDNGTNWQVFSEAGANPSIGGRSLIIGTAVQGATPTQITVTLNAGTQLPLPGNYVYFYNSRQMRKILYRLDVGNATNVNLNAPVAIVAGERIAIVRVLPNGKLDSTSFGSGWLNTLNGSVGAWSAGISYTLGTFTYSNSATPDSDEAVWNPTRHVEAYGNPAIAVAIGGDGTCGSNDGILNNQQMCDFINNLNASYPGRGSIIATPGGHVTPAMNPTIIFPFFNAN